MLLCYNYVDILIMFMVIRWGGGILVIGIYCGVVLLKDNYFKN